MKRLTPQGVATHVAGCWMHYAKIESQDKSSRDPGVGLIEPLNTVSVTTLGTAVAGVRWHSLAGVWLLYAPYLASYV